MVMVRVLLVGSGGREHAIADALARGKECDIYAYMGSNNPGIARLSKERVVGNVNDVGAIAKWALARKTELAVIGPEAPLEKGLANELGKHEVLVCGPTREASRIEWDKAYARVLMKDNRIPGCPKFLATSDAREAAE